MVRRMERERRKQAERLNANDRLWTEAVRDNDMRQGHYLKDPEDMSFLEKVVDTLTPSPRKR